MLTEENAPFNFTEDGALKGIAVDLIVAAMKDAGSEVSPAEIQVVPWARGYDAARNQPGTMLFSMARTQERESLFSWVGPIYKAQIGLVAPQEPQHPGHLPCGAVGLRDRHRARRGAGAAPRESGGARADPRPRQRHRGQPEEAAGRPGGHGGLQHPGGHVQPREDGGGPLELSPSSTCCGSWTCTTLSTGRPTRRC